MAAPPIDLPTFSGENDQSVSSWLRIFRQRILANTEPHQWLDIVDARREDEAAKWADTTPLIRRMLADDAIECATEEDVRKFKEGLTT